VRALLIVNPHATSTTRLRRDAIARALASAVELEIVETRYRGHAIALARAAAADGRGLVITLGGDGTVNEAVNGLLGAQAPTGAAGTGVAGTGVAGTGVAGTGVAGTGAAGTADGAPEPTALAPLPGGSANVFARALGLPADPVDATGQVLDALARGRCRRVSLGRADNRYFTFSSGMGLDAEVVRAVEGRRAHGRAVSPALYVRVAVRQFYQLTDRRAAAVTVEVPGAPAAGPVFWCTVSNTSPWTYLGRRPVATNPQASFDTGLDVFGLTKLSTAATLSTLRQMLAARDQPPDGRGALARHDLAEVTLRAARPIAFQIDGEYVGEREEVTFRSVPRALRILM
jgi:diacylglycerol kinase family enzyme